MRRDSIRRLQGKAYSYESYKVNRGGKMKKDVITYFTMIKEQFASIENMEDEEKELFIASIHNEIRFRELRLAYHNVCSPILEKVFSLSTSSQIKSFFKVCIGSFYELFSDKSASHAMQALLYRAADILMEEYLSGKVIPWEKYVPREGEDHDDDDDESKDKKKIDDNDDNDDDDENTLNKTQTSQAKLKFGRRDPNQGPPVAMQDLLLTMCTELSTRWTRMMESPNGAYSLRTIMLILSGRTKLNRDTVYAIFKSNDATTGFVEKKKEQTVDDKKIEILSSSRAHIKHLTFVLNDITAAITELDEELLRSACFRPSIAPVFQTLISALAERNRKKDNIETLSNFIAKLLGWKSSKIISTKKGDMSDSDSDSSDSDSDSDSDSSDSDSDSDDDNDEKKDTEATLATELYNLGPGSLEHVSEMMGHSTSSYLLEVIFKYAPDTVLINFIYKHVAGKARQLALKSNATHCIARLFDGITTEHTFTMLYDELAPHFTEIINQNKAGVIWGIVECCARIKCKQTIVLKQLLTALNLSRTTERLFFSKLLALDTSGNKAVAADAAEENVTEEVTASSVLAKIEKNTINVQYLGSRIIQAIFKFSPQSMALLLSSIHSLNTETIVSLLKNNLGLRTMQAYILESPASMKEKLKILKKLEGRYTEIFSSNKDFRWFIEKVYFYADIDFKTMICKELLKNERRLFGIQYGATLLKKLNIAHYKTTYTPYEGEKTEEVKEQQQPLLDNNKAKISAMELFADILEVKPKTKPVTVPVIIEKVVSTKAIEAMKHDEDGDDDIDIDMEDETPAVYEVPVQTEIEKTKRQREEESESSDSSSDSDSDSSSDSGSDSDSDSGIQLIKKRKL